MLNDTDWYRNLSLDIEATREYYQRLEKNKALEIVPNATAIRITEDMLTQIDEFINYHDEYQEYLREVQQLKLSQSSYFNSFKIYS